MSYPRPCFGCTMGDHSKHDPVGTTRPGLIGGEYCDCPGGCTPEPLPDWWTDIRAALTEPTPDAEVQP